MTQLNTRKIDASIIIVGAGPVGLLLANLLGCLGVRTVIFEKGFSVVTKSMAIGITPPSLQILKQLNLDSNFIRRGVKIENAQVHGYKRRIGNLSFSKIPSEYRFILSLPQYKTMEVLEENLKKYQCVSLFYGMEFVEMKELEETIRITIKNLRNSRYENYDSVYVIGCDGSNSLVRQLSGLETVFSKYEHRFLMADFKDDTGLANDAHLFFTHLGAVESFPLPENRRRWIIQDDHRNQIDFHRLIHQVKGRTRFDLCQSDGVNLSWFQPQKIESKKYFKGNVILCGDACRVMSPIGGQGMNTGFADAYYLSRVLEKIVLKNKKPLPLLENYNRSRKFASKLATRRAERGMWIGTRKGRLNSLVRNLFLFFLLRKPCSNWVRNQVSMLPVQGFPLERVLGSDSLLSVDFPEHRIPCKPTVAAEIST